MIPFRAAGTALWLGSSARRGILLPKDVGDAREAMNSKQNLVVQIREQTAAIRSHVAGLDKVASEKENEQVIESLGDVRICLDSLEGAIDEKRLNTAPVLVLTDLVKTTTDVATAIANAVSDIDTHGGTFTNQVNALHRKLWADRLIDPAAEVRAHQVAAGKLDSDMSVVRDNMAKLEDGLKLKDKVEAAANAAEKLQGRAAEATSAAKADKATLDKLLAEATATHGTFTTRSTEIQKLLDDSKTSNTQVTALEADLKKWHGEIKSTREGIETLRDSTTSKLEEYAKDIASRQNDLDQIRERIEEQFRLVSSGALARAFGVRDRELFWTKWAWAVSAVLSYLGFVIVAVWQAKLMLENTAAFSWGTLAIRLAVAIPIGLLVWFLTVQFGRARRIQESYAFKETVASSFDAYRELVEKITKDPALKDNPAYADFIRQTIDGLYREPPMGKEEDDHPPHTRALKDATGLIKVMTRFVEETRK